MLMVMVMVILCSGVVLLGFLICLVRKEKLLDEKMASVL